MTLGQIIHEYREAHNMSMATFAERSGMSKAYIGVLEKGVHPNTGKPIAPSIDTIKNAADGMRVDFTELFCALDGNVTVDIDATLIPKVNYIPILGKIAAGPPIDIVEELDGEVETTEYSRDTHFALRIAGESMAPRIRKGDLVIVRKQETVEDGDIAVVCINGNEGTCKRVNKHDNYIMFISENPSFAPIICAESDDFEIKGKVVELRAKF